MLLRSLLLAALVLAGPARADQLILSASNVIGSSSAFGGFPASFIFNQQTGAVTDVSRSTYWLNPDGTGASTVYITIDLGAAYQLSELDLFNTSNASFGDRGTGNFRVVAGNSVVQSGGTGNFVLSGTTTVLVSGTLAAVTPGTSPTASIFNVSSTSSFRYLSFQPLSVASFNPPASSTAYGLNELRVFTAAVPEAGTGPSLLLGCVAVALAVSRRRRSS